MKAINSCENYTNVSIGAVVNGKGIISVTDNVSGQKLEKLDVFVESNSTYEDTQASNLMNSDPFYAKAAQVLSYMDNGLAYGTPLNVNYQSLNQAMPNVNRWRNAVENGSTNPDDFGYRYF